MFHFLDEWLRKGRQKFWRVGWHFLRRQKMFLPEKAAFDVVAPGGTCARYATAGHTKACCSFTFVAIVTPWFLYIFSVVCLLHIFVLVVMCIVSLNRILYPWWLLIQCISTSLPVKNDWQLDTFKTLSFASIYATVAFNGRLDSWFRAITALVIKNSVTANFDFLS